MALPGMFWGGLAGYLVAGSTGLSTVAAALLGALGGLVLLGGGGGLVVLLVTDRVGNLAQGLYNPSGRTTPHKYDYSYAKSLAARGAHLEAIQAYEESVARDPADPVPYVAVARILRDELKRFEEAAGWFRRARREANLDRGHELLIARELVEIYRVKLDEPFKAAPELARLAESFADTPEGEWAEGELRDLKREMEDGI